MTTTELMVRVARLIEGLGLAYAVTGSMASTFYGEMRTTNDVDMLIDLPLTRVQDFVAAFPPDEYYVSDIAVLWAIEHRSQFNIIHPSSGFKVDLIVPGDSAHDRMELDRAIRVARRPGEEVMFCAPEDVILKKLWFYQLGESDKHLRDIASMLKISREQIDRDYITEWTTKLGLSDIWGEMCKRVP